MSTLDTIKNKLVNQNVPALNHLWSTVSFRPVGWDGLVIGFDSHIRDLDRVKVGTSFKLCSGKPIEKYRLIVKSDGGQLVFNWKDGVKPKDWLKIERDLLI